MVYHYDNGFLTVPKSNGLRAWLKGEEIRIGYQTRNEGAYWTPNQLIKEDEKELNKKRQFELVVERIRQQVPHTRIRYAIKESTYREQIQRT